MIGINLDILVWNVLLFQNCPNTLDCVGISVKRWQLLPRQKPYQTDKTHPAHSFNGWGALCLFASVYASPVALGWRPASGGGMLTAVWQDVSRRLPWCATFGDPGRGYAAGGGTVLTLVSTFSTSSREPPDTWRIAAHQFRISPESSTIHTYCATSTTCVRVQGIARGSSYLSYSTKLK